MSVLKFDETPYEEIKNGLKRKIIHTSNLMTVIADFTSGPWDKPEPPHSHPHEQTSYVASGEIIFFCEDEEEEHLKAGDMFAVSPHKKHTIQLLTEKARIIDNFYPLRQEFIK